MGMSIEVHGASDVAKKLRERAQRAKNLTPVLKVRAVELEQIALDSFDSGSSPGGDRWPDLAPSTVLKRALSRGGKRRKKARRGAYGGVDLGLSKKAARNISNLKMLVDTARGRNATSVKAQGSTILFRNNVGYMRAHLGGDTKRNPQRPPRRQWAPFIWNGSRWVYDYRGRGGGWMRDMRRGVRTYVLTGATS